MGLNDTPSGERMHIGFFGRRNAGKSSLVNAVTGQDLSVVSDTRGTTTDPVRKAMELLPVGPVLIIDTPGFDDVGSLGELRVKKTRQILDQTDVAVLVVDALEGLCQADQDLLALFREKAIPWITVYNKADLLKESGSGSDRVIYVSSTEKTGIHELKERIAALGKEAETRQKSLPLAGDLVRPGDLAVLVIPIDKAAPKGRLILPQQQMIRDLLDHDACPVCVKENELAGLLNRLGTRPAMVITDSQVFAEVDRELSSDLPLTSFSILMARYKGFLDTAVRGAAAISRLREGDRVLIAEGCTHHRQCDDIGTVKLPRWLQETTGKTLRIETSSGRGFPEDLRDFSLVIHCGGCMLNQREVLSRMRRALDQDVPFTNYGIAIASMKGILKRSVELFPEVHALLEDQQDG